MFPLSLVFHAVLALSVASAATAAMVALLVDTRERPAAKVLVAKLMEVALLGAGALAMLQTGSAE